MTTRDVDHLVFLSHNSADKPTVETLAFALLDAGVRPWLDKWDLVGGRSWQAAIAAAIQNAHAVAVCIGKHGLGQVQGPEVEVALDRAWRDANRVVVPVLLPGAAEHPDVPDFLRQRTWVDLRAGLTAAAVQRLVAAIHGRATGPAARADAACPYPGLFAFGESDAPRFFGREDDVAALLARLAKGERLLTLVGASGSGKSSLMRAGLIPAVRTGQVDGRYDWPIVLIRPGPRPLHALAVQVVGLEGGDTARLDELKGALRSEASTLSDRIDLWLARVSVSGRDGMPPRVLLAVDQFEEVFTQAEDAEERRAFVANVLHASAGAGGRITVVLALRADFLGRALVQSQALAEALKRSQEVVLSMAPAQLRAAVERPALQARVRFEDGLVDTLVRAVADQPGDLPLLQFALRELWGRREGEGRVLTWSAYEAIKGVRGAIAERAEAFLRQPDLDGAKLRDLRRVLGRLVQLGEGAVDTRRRASRDELEGIEVAHEALIREWKTLREWIEADRDALRLHQDLSRDARRREASGDKAAHLWRGAELTRAVAAIDSARLVPSPVEREFVAASRAAEQGERFRRRAWVAARVAALILAVGVAGTLVASAGRLGWTWWTLGRNVKWVGIPAPERGTFLMGCVPADHQCRDNEKLKPGEPREIPLSRGFSMMAHEVTVAQFRQFVKGGPSTIAGRWILPKVKMGPQPEGAEPDHPVVRVSWDDARAFCAFVGGRLPTEAEWEYAARGDKTGKAQLVYPWGNDWRPDQANGATSTGMARVGSFPRNGFELYNMIGNVWEWTSSLHRPYPYRNDGREDPQSKEARVVRGGSWGDLPGFLRASNRVIDDQPSNRDLNHREGPHADAGPQFFVGFRCARDGSP